MNQGMFETLADCYHSVLGWDGQYRYYYPGTYAATLEDTNGDTRWTFSGENTWECIRGAYIFIENVDRVPDMSGEEQGRLKA